MRVIVLANGEWDSEWGRSELSPNLKDMIICADGGADLAISSGVMPDVLIGDLDSITMENLDRCRESGVKIEKFPSQKDETDLELAIKYADNYLRVHGSPEDEILLYAAGGKRLDHLQGNLALMLGFAQKGRRIKMIDVTYEAWVALAGEARIRGFKGQEISLIAMSEKAEVSAQGLYYKLDNLTLLQNTTRGISNVFTGEEAKITIHNGCLLIVVIKDKNKTLA